MGRPGRSLPKGRLQATRPLAPEEPASAGQPPICLNGVLAAVGDANLLFHRLVVADECAVRGELQEAERVR